MIARPWDAVARSQGDFVAMKGPIRAELSP
jgi:hypothetical protein